jgi:hypothetical protein
VKEEGGERKEEKDLPNAKYSISNIQFKMKTLYG